ncbi:BTB/POZ domain-containing protein 8-like [Styela clava]
MDLTKTKLSKNLARTLEKDVKSFSDNLTEMTGSLSPNLLQSKLLLDSDLPSPSCDLGQKLLNEFFHPQASDIVLKAENECFLCHKEVLMTRCSYFKAMFQNTWTEKNSKEITLNNVKPEAVAALLCFLYGASSELPRFCPLLDILQIADMYGMAELTTVAKYHIKSEMCHSFHRPCKDCIANAPEVIQLASFFSLNDLFAACLKWNTKYFYKLWPNKGFASMQVDLREKCVKAVMDSLNDTNAISLLMETDKFLSSITRVQWTKPVVAMGTTLMTSCCDYIALCFLALVRNKTLMILFEGIGWKIDVVDRILTQISSQLSIENVCGCHLAVSRLIYLSDKESWNQEFSTMLLNLKITVWCFLVSNYFAVIHTESWNMLSATDKMTLKSETICQGDTSKKLSKRPVLSSSLNKNSVKPLKQTAPVKNDQKKQIAKAKAKNQNMKLSCNNKATNSNNTPSCSESRRSEAVNLPTLLPPIIARQELMYGWVIEEVVTKPIPA